jgi:hypothetical protein
LVRGRIVLYIVRAARLNLPTRYFVVAWSVGNIPGTPNCTQFLFISVRKQAHTNIRAIQTVYRPKVRNANVSSVWYATSKCTGIYHCCFAAKSDPGWSCWKARARLVTAYLTVSMYLPSVLPKCHLRVGFLCRCCGLDLSSRIEIFYGDSGSIPCLRKTRRPNHE